MNTDETREGQAPFPGLASRFVQVFVSPGALFERLVEKPVWGGAMILGAAMVLVGVALLPPDLYLAEIRQSFLQRGQPFPSEIERSVGLVRIGGAVAAVVSWSVILAVFAGLVTVVFAFILGDEGTYRQYLSVMVHAQLVAAMSGLVVLPLKIMAGDLRLLLSVGTFAFFLEDGYAFRFLSLLDLFSLWAWMLVGLGAARIGRREAWVPGAVGLLVIPVVLAAIIAIFNG